jgi:hypothetical protein
VNPLRDFLTSISPVTRERLRAVLIHDIQDPREIGAVLQGFDDHNGGQWHEILAMLAVRPELRRAVVRELGEIAAAG